MQRETEVATEPTGFDQTSDDVPADEKAQEGESDKQSDLDVPGGKGLIKEGEAGRADSPL